MPTRVTRSLDSPPSSAKVLWRATAFAILSLLAFAACADAPKPLAPEAEDAQLAAQGALLSRAIEAQERVTEDLLSRPGIVGTGIGLDADGSPRLVVFAMTAAHAAQARLPAQVDGLPVAVEVSGMFVARDPDDPTTRERPAPLGFSVGHPQITAGTIGARVKDAAGNIYILSNNHVLANSNNASIGDAALQPGPFDGGSEPADRIGTLADFEPISFSSNNIMDAAVALVDGNDLSGSTEPQGYGAPGTTVVDAALEMSVQKYGRTTGLTTGTVSAINVTVSVCYVTRGPFMCAQAATFVNQIAITPGAFSAGGDSGSLIVTHNANRNPVALLFAGSSTQTIASPIGPVLTRFGVVIDPTDGGGAPPQPVTDLDVTAVSAPASVTQGTTASVSVTVENVGNRSVGSFVITLRDETDNVTIGTSNVGSLAAGASVTRSFDWNTSGVSTGDHTLVGAHDLADDDPGNDTNSTTVNVTAPGSPGMMHVAALNGASVNNGSTWTANVTATIRDASNQAVPDATVSGTWSNGASGSTNCVTGVSGQCTVSVSGMPKRTGSVTFSVTGVTHASLTYAPESNVVSSVTVSKP